MSSSLESSPGRTVNSRLPLLVLIASVGMFLGAGVVTAWLLLRHHGQTRMYRAEAQLLFSPVDSGVVCFYSGQTQDGYLNEYVLGQCKMICSEREIDLSLYEPDWTQTQLGSSDAMLDDYTSRLNADHAGGLLTIAFVHEDPSVALAGVKAALGAYNKLYQEAAPDMTIMVIKLLSDDKKATDQSIAALQEKMNSEAPADQQQQLADLKKRSESLAVKIENLQNAYSLANRMQISAPPHIVGQRWMMKEDAKWVEAPQ